MGKRRKNTSNDLYSVILMIIISGIGLSLVYPIVFFTILFGSFLIFILSKILKENNNTNYSPASPKASDYLKTQASQTLQYLEKEIESKQEEFTKNLDLYSSTLLKLDEDIELKKQELKEFTENYDDLLKLDQEIVTKQQNLKRFTESYDDLIFIEKLDDKINLKKQELKNIHHITDLIEARNSLNKEIKDLQNLLSSLEEKQENLEMNFFSKTYVFERSHQYEQALKENKESQKNTIKNISLDFHTKQIFNLAIRSFNVECETFIENIKWNNFDALKKKIENSYDQINRILERASTAKIPFELYDLKLKKS